MKHAILAFLLMILSSPALAADKEGAFERVVRTNTIRCGYAMSPPVMEKDPNTGALYGFDYDLWQEIGKELALKIEFTEEVGYGNFIEGLRTGRYDAFCSEIWPDPTRAKHLSLTINPVLYSFLKTFVRADDHRFDKDLELVNSPDVSVPAIEGDVSVSMVTGRFPKAKIYYLPQTASVSEAIESIKTKKADIIFLDQAMMNDFEKQNPGVLRALDHPSPYVFSSYFSVKGGEIQLRDMIDLALRKIIDDGRLERLAKKYSKDYVTPRRNYDPETGK